MRSPGLKLIYIISFVILTVTHKFRLINFCWSRLLVVSVGHVCSTLLVTSAGYVWWSLLLVSSSGHVCWSRLLVTSESDGHVFWSSLSCRWQCRQCHEQSHQARF